MISDTVNVSSSVSDSRYLPGTISDFFNIIKLNKESNVKHSEKERKYVFPGGTPIGIKIYCDGVIIVGTDDIETESGKVNPAISAGLKKGDIIKTINGERVNGNSSVSNIIQNAKEKNLEFVIERDKKEKTVNFSCVLDKDGLYKAGIWVRDSSAGIGTVSFITEDGYFGSLGHGICDIDTGEVMPLGKGVTSEAEITGIYKGYKGYAGQLCGVLDNMNNGVILENGETGIYGLLTDFSEDISGKIPVAFTDEIIKGEAEIISTVENNITKHYKAEITDINYNSSENKNMVVKITDTELLDKTGGIIQGMSGSPIIQNGKFVGAVTHVLVDDPTTGYAIFAENMLETVGNVANSEKTKDTPLYQ